MVKKLFSMVILLAAALSFCAVSPAGQDSVVFASASYGSSKLELYARKVASEINRQRAAAGLDPVIFCDSLNEVAILRGRFAVFHRAGRSQCALLRRGRKHRLRSEDPRGRDEGVDELRRTQGEHPLRSL